MRPLLDDRTMGNNDMTYRLSMLLFFMAVFGAVVLFGTGFSQAGAATQTTCEETVSFCSVDPAPAAVTQGCPYRNKAQKAQGECPFKKAQAAKGEKNSESDDMAAQAAVECPYKHECGKDCKCNKTDE